MPLCESHLADMRYICMCRLCAGGYLYHWLCKISENVALAGGEHLLLSGVMSLPWHGISQQKYRSKDGRITGESFRKYLKTEGMDSLFSFLSGTYQTEDMLGSGHPWQTRYGGTYEPLSPDKIFCTASGTNINQTSHSISTYLVSVGCRTSSRHHEVAAERPA